MSVIPISKNKMDWPPELSERIDPFMEELMGLCNKHRIGISIRKIYMGKDGVEILDVGGWTHDKEHDELIPFYVIKNGGRVGCKKNRKLRN